jgi:hypothetical protein
LADERGTKREKFRAYLLYRQSSRQAIFKGIVAREVQTINEKEDASIANYECNF